MSRLLADYRIFFSEFRARYRTTGAVMPSGPALCRALSRFVRERPGPNRILEVGPGTGAVTARIVDAMGPEDRLDLVELNDQFVAHLRQRLTEEPSFRAVADRTQIFHDNVESLESVEPYDIIVSGLPLNNFSVVEVERILEVLTQHLRPGGTLSFFEYIAIRRVKALLSGAADRERLHGISRTLARLFGEHTHMRQWVWPNVPPAWVHHVRVDRGKPEGTGESTERHFAER